MWTLGYPTGADYVCPINTKVVATRDGVVHALTWGTGSGIHVIIESKDVNDEPIRHV